MSTHGGASRQPLVLSVFTGAGGLDLGLEQAGMHVRACIDFDPACRRTASLNRPNRRFLDPGDITRLAKQLKPEDLGLKRGALSVLAGGPPCQPFSKAAQWTSSGANGLKDSRGKCFVSFLDLVDAFLPQVVLVENVPGFGRGANSTLDLIRRRLRRLNRRSGTSYTLDVRIVDAADYGVPQKRQRCIVLSNRDGCELEWPRPSYSGRPVRAWDAIGDLRGDDDLVASGRWAELLPSVPEGWNYLWHTDRGGGLPLFGYRTRYWSFLLKLAKDRPAWTLPAQPGPATGPFHWHNRPLTVKEMLRVQSFPRSWRVSGDYRSQVAQVGNATPPLLAEVVGRAIGRQWLGLSYRGKPTLTISRKRSVPPPEDTVEVPKKYHHLSGPHPAHPGSGKGPRPTRSDQVALS